MRTALLELYGNQVIDNLINARNGLPLLQMDYSNVTGQITQEGSGGLGGSQVSANTGTPLPVFVNTLTRSVQNTLNYSANLRQANQLSVSGKPVVDINEVYNAYLSFLSKPERLMQTCDPPPPGAAHVVRKCGDVYYWVPTQFKYDYLRLYLVTTVQRGQPLSVPDQYETTVVGFLGVENLGPDQKSHRILLQIAPGIPNENGVMTANVNGAIHRIEVMYRDVENPIQGTEELPDALPSQIPAFGQVTDRVQIFYNEPREGNPDDSVIPATVAELQKALAGQKVRVRLEFSRPKVPTTESLLESLRNETELIRLNQNLQLR